MAIAGRSPGSGRVDILGWQFRLGQIDVQTSQIGSSALPWRCSGNTAVGVLRVVVRRAVERDVDAEPGSRGLPAGAGRQPDADHPGARRPLRRRRRARPLLWGRLRAAPRRAARRRRPPGERRRMSVPGGVIRLLARSTAIGGIGVSRSASGSSSPPLTLRAGSDRSRSVSSASPQASGRSRGACGGSGGGRSRSGLLDDARGAGARVAASGTSTPSSCGRRYSPRCSATRRRSTFAAIGGLFSGALRRREHRPRGDDARGRVLRDPGRAQGGLVGLRPPVRRWSRAARWR